MLSRFLPVLLLTLLSMLACSTPNKPNPKPQTKPSDAQLSTPTTDTVPNTASGTFAATSVRTSNGFSEADFARHVTELHTRIKTKLSSDKFSIIVQPPFVMVGD